MDEEKLLQAIENLRAEMKKNVVEKGTIDKEIVKMSQKLDKLLNDYQRLIEK